MIEIIQLGISNFANFWTYFESKDSQRQLNSEHRKINFWSDICIFWPLCSIRGLLCFRWSLILPYGLLTLNRLGQQMLSIKDIPYRLELGWHCFCKSWKFIWDPTVSHSTGPSDSKKSNFSKIGQRLVVPHRPPLVMQ